MITNRNLLALVVVTAACVAVTAVLYSGKAGPAGAFQSGTLLIQGLAPEKVHSILISKGKDTVTLTRFEKDKEKGFTVGERENYVASNGRINQFLLAAMEIRCKEKITDAKENYGELGVADDAPDAVTVRLRDAEGKVLLGFVKGKNADGGGAYVRLLDRPTVYATEGYLNIDATPAGYLDKTLIQAKREQVQRVDVQSGKDKYTLAKGDKDALVLQPIPEGKRAKDSALQDVFNALGNLDFTDVTPAKDLALTWDATYTCQLESGLVYTVKLAKKDEKHYVQVSAKGPDVSSVSITKTESDAELKKKEAVLLAVETAQKFTPKHAPWVYQVQSWSADRLRKPLADLVEDLPKEETEKGKAQADR